MALMPSFKNLIASLGIAFAITACSQKPATEVTPEAEQVSRNDKAAKFCQCLVHVRTCLGLPANPNSVSAADYGAVLSANGYTKKTLPSVGNVVIFKRAFGGGISTAHGHIGFVSSNEIINAGTANAYRRIKIKSANWSSTGLFTECTCNNVSISGWINLNTNTRLTNIEYWSK